MMIRRSLGVVVVAIAVGVPVVRCQTLYVIHGGVPGTSTVTELKGPPSLPFGYPGGPIVSSFPTTVPFACPTAGALAPPPIGVLGDVAFDRAGDVVWATDGATITSYTPAGVPLSSFPPPPFMGPITGLAFANVPGAGVLYMTDGVLIQGVVPLAPGCGAPFVLPIFFPSPSPGLLTDLDWDPVSGTFFGCDTLGFVTNIGPAGGVGPFGIFPAAGLCAPGLAAPLQGLAVDTTVAFAPPVLYVTDGFAINRASPPGVAAGPTFYTPAPCFPVLAAAPVNGLAFSLHPIRFGLPCHTAGGMLPTITATGNSASPGAMTIGVTGAPPGAPAILMLSLAVGPPVPFKGCSLIAIPFTTISLFIPAGGTLVLPVALAPGVPIGLSLYLQWVIVDAPGLAISSGMAMTIGMP